MCKIKQISSLTSSIKSIMCSKQKKKGMCDKNKIPPKKENVYLKEKSLGNVQLIAFISQTKYLLENSEICNIYSGFTHTFNKYVLSF